MPSHNPIIFNDPYYCERCMMSHKWKHQDFDMRRFPEEIRECCKNATGSHYHCGRCDKVGGMYGCYRSIHYVDGKRIDVGGHFCCPDDCELAGE